MILLILGTRPEQLKFAPVWREMKRRGMPVHVHCTGQSPDLLDEATMPWDSFGEKPPHTNFTAAMVWGDTRTAFNGAMWAFENQIPLMHGEAGVRTYDLASPWPEEGYRQMISRIATYHACTTRWNAQALHPSFTVWPTDDYRCEFAVRDLRFLRITGSPIVESVRERLKPADIVLPTQPPEVVLTLHRRENRGRFADIIRGAVDAAEANGFRILWSVHPNDFAYNEMPDDLLGKPIQMAKPLNPRSFASALAGAACVVTDSGGVQEESHILKVPCCVVRTTTDRPESLGAGGARLAGNTREGVAAAIRECLAIDRSTISGTAFGDGTASERIVSWWSEILEGSHA